MTIQKQTSAIFEILSKGMFICSNSPTDTIRRLYNYLDQNFETLFDYFLKINFILEKKDEYYYFSKKESKVDLERKIEISFKWIDIVDFFKSFENSFGSGFRFSPSDILVKLKIDAGLKNKLNGLKRYTREETFTQSIQKLIEILRREGFIELENEISNSYKVLSSFHYLEELIMNINIPEEIQHEIPQ